ncbi:MAG TPA: hypothetical protein VEH29_00445 [Acidimicrobiales bacterium]|nr:hypothetical protein [Acidimicrobiales bacterium]
MTGELPPKDVPERAEGSPASETADAGTPPERPVQRNDDPLIPEVFRNTIPPPPRGWSEDDWRKSFLGDQTQGSRGQGLSFGKGWLLALVLGLVALVLIIFIIIAH